MIQSCLDYHRRAKTISIVVKAPFGSAQYEAKLGGFPVSVSVIPGGRPVPPSLPPWVVE